jgi:hypothetical protein
VFFFFSLSVVLLFSILFLFLLAPVCHWFSSMATANCISEKIYPTRLVSLSFSFSSFSLYTSRTTKKKKKEKTQIRAILCIEMDCNFLCSLPFRVWILILMCVCVCARVGAAGGRIETKTKRVRKSKKATEIMLRKATAHVLIKQKSKKKRKAKVKFVNDSTRN